MDSLSHTVGRCVIEVRYVDITTLAVDVIVSSDDTELSMGGGVSHAIRVAGGEEIFDEAQKALPLKLEDVVSTSAGRLNAGRVFHAAVLYYDDETQERRTSADVVRAVVRKCLGMCTAAGARSVAFPALATGTAGLSAERSASAMMVEILAYLERAPAMTAIYLALDPKRDVGPRFFRQVEQYLAIAESVRRGDRAVADAERFRPAAAAAPPTDRGRLAQVRTDLDAGMIEHDAVEFAATLAPQVSDQASTALEELGVRLGQQIETAGKDAGTTRMQVERLNLLLEATRQRRAQIEQQNINEAKASPERAAQEQFLRDREKTLQDEIAALTSASRPLVMSLHGIRTRGTWQKDITLPLNRAGFDHKEVDYGYFNVIRFLLPGARRQRVEDFRKDYERYGGRTATGYPSLIAHSLGSYIATRAMSKYGLQFDRIILCGSIVEDDYDWDSLFRGGVVTGVLNDCGSQDIWARLARRGVTDAGQSGLKGFEKTAGGKVINRNHREFGHSDYFYEKNYLESWIPFLQGKAPSPLTNTEPPRTNWRVAVTLLIVLAIAVSLYWYFR